jgi:hypothetical protein
MSDDIVNRLREYWLTYHAHPVANEAADEIERLCKENIELKSEIQRLNQLAKY